MNGIVIGGCKISAVFANNKNIIYIKGNVEENYLEKLKNFLDKFGDFTINEF